MARTFEDVIVHFQSYDREKIEFARFWWNASREVENIDKQKESLELIELLLRQQEEQS